MKLLVILFILEKVWFSMQALSVAVYCSSHWTLNADWLFLTIQIINLLSDWSVLLYSWV